MASSNNVQQIVEIMTGMNALELAELSKAVQDHFGVKPMAMAAPAADASAPEASKKEEKTEFKVTLKDVGSEKIKVIKALRQVISLDLMKAKAMVDSVPAVVIEAAPKDKAEQIKAALEEAGAKVELS